MGIVQKQGTWNTILTYLGIGLGYLNVVILFPTYFSTEQVGLVRLMTFVAMIYSQFSSIGAQNVAVRFAALFRTEQRSEHTVLRHILKVSGIALVVVSLVYIALNPLLKDLYAEGSPLFVEFMLYVIPLAIAILLFDILDGYAKSIFRSVFPTFLRDVLLRISTTLIITLFAIGIVDLDQFILLYIAVFWLNAVILAIYIALNNTYLPDSKKTRIGRAEKKSMLLFGLFSLLSGVTNLILNTVDSLMIGSMMNLTDVGIYTTIAFVAVLIMVPARSIYKTTTTLIAEHWGAGEMAELGKLYKSVSIINLITGGYIFVMVLIGFNYLMLYLPEDYRIGYYVFLYLGIGKLFDAATGVNGPIILHSKYFKIDVVFTIAFAVVSITLNYLLIPKYGIDGAAMASMISIFIFNLSRIVFVFFKFKLQPFSVETPIILILLGAVFGLNELLPQLKNVHFDFIYRIGTLSIVYLSVLFAFKISDDFQDYSRKALKKFGL